MGYLAFHDHGCGADVAAGAAAARASAGAANREAASGKLTKLEWSVVRLARGDRLDTVRPAGWLTRAIRAMLRVRNPKLADNRLEALRRMAVLAWHDGYTVPAYEVRAFLAAGFSPRQYEALVDQIGAARPASSRVAAIG